MNEKNLSSYLEKGGLDDDNVQKFNGKLSLDLPLASLTGISPDYSVNLKYNYSIENKMSYGKLNDLWGPGEVGANWAINKSDKIMRVSLTEKPTSVEDLIGKEIIYWVSSTGVYEFIHNETIDEGEGWMKLKYSILGDPDTVVNRIISTSDLLGGKWEILSTTGSKYKFDINENLEEEDHFLMVKSKLEEAVSDYSEINSSSVSKEVLWENNGWFSKYLSTNLGYGLNPENQNESINEWNLTSIEDKNGNATKFYYISEIMPIGKGNKNFTVYNYLYKVENSNGSKLVFNYKAKDSKEVVRKHQISQEPNGYQEKLERLYIDSIDVIDRSGILRKELKYSEINPSTEYSKRILVEVKEKTYSKKTLDFIEKTPSYIFEYYEGKDGVSIALERGKDFIKDGGLFGALKSIVYPTGLKISYEYDRLALKEKDRIGFLSVSEESGLQKIEHIATSDYFILSGEKDGQKILRLHDWTMDGWSTIDLYKDNLTERDYLASGNCQYNGRCIAFVSNTGDVIIYERSKSDLKSWIQIKKISEPSIASGDENLPHILMGENEITIFYPKLSEATDKKVKILKKDKLLGSWEEDLLEFPLDERDFSREGIVGNQEYKMSIRGRLLVIGHIYRKQDKPWINLVLVKFDNSMSKIISKKSFNNFGSYLHDDSENENEFCRAGSTIKPGGFSNISIMDNYISLHYKTACEYKGGEMMYNYDWCQILSYKLDTLNINNHPFQNEISNDGMFPVDGVPAYYIPNFSVATGKQFILFSYSIGVAKEIIKDSESGLGYPDTGNDDEERYYEKYRTKTLAYIYNGVNWETRHFNGTEWEDANNPLPDEDFFRNLGCCRFGAMDVGIFNKTAQVIPNTHGDIDRQQKEYLVYDEVQETFLVRYLPSAPQEVREIGEDDVEEHPDMDGLLKQRKKIVRRIFMIEVMEEMALAYVTRGGSAGASLGKVTKELGKDVAIDTGVNKAMNNVPFSQKARLNKKVDEIDAKIAQCQHEMFVKALKDSFEITSYSSNFDRFVVEEGAVLFRNYSDEFVVASDYLHSRTGGDLLPHSFFSPKTDRIPFLTKESAKEGGTRKIGWVRFTRGHGLSDVAHSFWASSTIDLGEMVEVFGSDYNVAVYNTCHKKYNEGQSECDGPQPSKYVLVKLHNDFSSYNQDSINSHIEDFVVSKSKTHIDQNKVYEVDYKYTESEARYMGGIGAIFSEVHAAYDTQIGGLGDYVKVYKFLNGTEEITVDKIHN